MDALRIKTLEEDNAFLRGQVKLLQARNSQLEARIAQLSAFIPSSSSSVSSSASASTSSASTINAPTPVDPQSQSASRSVSDDEAQFARVQSPQEEERGEQQPGSASTVVGGQDWKSTNPPAYHGPPLETSDAVSPRSASFASRAKSPTTPITGVWGRSYDPPTPRPTPIRSKPPTPVLGVPTSSVIRITHASLPAGGGSGGRYRSKTLPPLATSLTSASSNRRGAPTILSAVNGTPTHAIPPPPMSITHPSILKRIFQFATSTHLISTDPFFQDATTNAWFLSLKTIKSLCLLSKECHILALPLLYTSIRLRRIPQLAALVQTLEFRARFTPPWLVGSNHYGSYTRSLDLSFYIPPEWNNLYVEDVRRLIACVPNLQIYRSRPMLAIEGPRPVPPPIMSCLGEMRNELLSELELSEQEGPQMTDLVRLLQSCTYLEALTLGLYVFDGGLGRETPVLRLPSLKRLEVKVTNRSTPGSFASFPSPHVLVEASKWDLPHLEALTLVLHDEIKVPFTALNPFLNIHGHKLKTLTLRDVNPLMRAPPLQISGILSRCPNLLEVKVVASSTAPLHLARPHACLERVRFLGVAPGSKQDGGNSDALLEHLTVFSVDNLESRARFPSLKEIVIQGEEDVKATEALRFLWQDSLGSDVRVICVGIDGDVVDIPSPTQLLAMATGTNANGTKSSWDTFGGVEEDDEEEWLPSDPDDEPDDESTVDGEGARGGWNSDDEYEYLAGDEDDLGEDEEETVKDSRSGRGRDDDQFDHTTALLIFQDSSAPRKGRHSFVPSFSVERSAAAAGGTRGGGSGSGGARRRLITNPRASVDEHGRIHGQGNGHAAHASLGHGSSFGLRHSTGPDAGVSHHSREQSLGASIGHHARETSYPSQNGQATSQNHNTTINTNVNSAVAAGNAGASAHAGTTSVVSAGRMSHHGSGTGTTRVGSVDLKRTSMGPSSSSRMW